MKKETEKNDRPLNMGVLIDTFHKTGVLVVGDVMLDRFVYGSIHRISPEAPIPILRFKHEKKMLGGAANVAANLKALGCNAAVVGLVGDDAAGEDVARLLADADICADLFRIRGIPTTVKTRLIAGDRHLLRIDFEEESRIEERDRERLSRLVKRRLRDVQVLLVSDYGKGVVSAGLCKEMIKAARSSGKTIIVDPKGNDWDKYSGATLIKPNLKEFCLVTGEECTPDSGDFRGRLIDGARKIFRKYNIDGLLVTLSEHGMAFISRVHPKQVIHLPTRAREVFDVSGAGDTSAAVLAAALGSGVPIERAMQMANAAAGIVVGKLGTATVTDNELKAAVSAPGDRPSGKILSQSALVREVQVLKRQGVKVGFTNGCFDCCHLGHLSSLRQAKRLCDVLVVGVNSDAWIRAHKGPGRPIQDEATRSLLLASLEYVDFVCLFDDETALPLVKKIRPHVIAKEGYPLSKWPEGRYVKSIGGEAVALRREEGYSTTALFSKAEGE